MENSSLSLHRLHWSSLLFDALSQARQLVLPAILALFGAARGDLFWFWIAAIFFIPAVLFSVFRYLTFRYSIQDGKLVINQGLIFRNVRTVPVDRIQNLDFVQNVLHRAFGVAELKIETAAGSEPEARLRVLSLEQIEKLRDSIFGQRELSIVAEAPLPISEESNWDSLVPDVQAPPDEVILKSRLWDLIKVGIASNRGMVMVGIVLGLLYQSDLLEQLDLKKFQQLLTENGDRNVWIVLGSVLFLASLVLLRALSIAWYVLRFYGYILVRRGDDLRISCGLLTRVNATVPRQRIQLISVHQNLLMRWMRLSSVRIETAGGTQNHDDASESVSSRWFVPVVSSSEVVRLIRHLRPGVDWKFQEESFQAISLRAGRRSARVAMLQAFVVSIVGLAITRPWGWLAGPVALPFLIWYALAEVRAMKYGWSSDGVIFRSGVFTRKTSITFFEKIQSIEWQQSPFDRRWAMARLLIDTAASGPADHRIDIPMLDLARCNEELKRLTKLAASHQPVFR